MKIFYLQQKKSRSPHSITSSLLTNDKISSKSPPRTGAYSPLKIYTPHVAIHCVLHSLASLVCKTQPIAHGFTLIDCVRMLIKTHNTNYKSR